MAIKRCHSVLGTTGWPAGGGAGRILQDGCVFGWHLASQDGFTALMKAAQGGHKDTVEVLLPSGADRARASRAGCGGDGGGVMAGWAALGGLREVLPGACREGCGC